MAEKVAEAPVHIGFVPAVRETETVAGAVEFTVMVKGTLLTVVGLAHTTLEVKMQVTIAELLMLELE